MRGVFLDLETYKPDERHPAFLKPTLEEWNFYDATPPDEVLDRIKGADIVVINKVQITREILENTEGLKLVVAGATGVDNVDIAAAADLGIRVCNVQGYSTESVAQHAFGLILSLSSSLISYHNLVQTGAWQKAAGFNLLEYPLIELHGKTLGILGYGDIGKSVERIAKAFGMNVLLADRKNAHDLRAGRTEFEEVVKASDVLTVHCPLSDETRGLISTNELEMMKSSATLINVSRGGIVDEQALADALRAGAIAGAALDVLSKEPPRDGNPLLEPDIPNLIITPHCAWASVEARLRMFEQIAAVIEAFKSGQPMNVVA